MRGPFRLNLNHPYFAQAFDKEVMDVRRRELAVPLMTTEGEEMGLAGFVESFQSAYHGVKFTPGGHPVSAAARSPALSLSKG